MNDIAQQNLADAREVVNAGKLMLQGYTVSRPLSGACRYDLIAEKSGRFIKIQVKNLKRDPAYKNSPLPYPVYVLEAYSDPREEGLYPNASRCNRGV